MSRPHLTALVRLAVLCALALALLPLGAALQTHAAGEPVAVWLTTPDQTNLLTQQPSLAFGPDSGGNPLTITVDETQTYQQMVGFGASLTDSSAYLISNTLTPSQRDALMTSLFDPQRGIGLSFMRQPIGASDFIAHTYLNTSGPTSPPYYQDCPYYSYDDNPADAGNPALPNFSIAHDQAYIIPLLKQAQGLNPANFRILATPWSPPGWMKQQVPTGACGTYLGFGAMAGGTMTSTNPLTDTVWAQYFVKTVQAYQAQGLPIYAVTLQNEPTFQTGTYPQMTLSYTDEANLAGRFLGPAFANAGIDTKILLYDDTWKNPTYPIDTMNQLAALPGPTAGSSALDYVAGTAFHCYQGTPDAQSTVQAAYPSKDIYFTECNRGGVAPWNIPNSDFAGGFKQTMQNLIIGATRNWARTIDEWNVALDQNHGPLPPNAFGHASEGFGCNNCNGVVTIDTSNLTATPTPAAGSTPTPAQATITYNEDYYALGHLSKFVQPGAVRIGSNTFGSSSVDDVAFRNPDGSTVLLAYNGAASPSTLTVRWNGEAFNDTLPAGAAVTFTWSGTATGTTTPSPTGTATAIQTAPAATATPTTGATSTSAPPPSVTPTATHTPIVVHLPTDTPTASATATGTAVGSLSSTSTPTEVPSPTATETATGTPTPTNTPTGTATPSPTSTATGTSTPTSTGTPTGTATPTTTAPATGTASPSNRTSPTPTTAPSRHPTPTATARPRRHLHGLSSGLTLGSHTVASGTTLHVRVHTAAHAKVRVMLQVKARKAVVVGKGKHRKKTTRTVVYYTVAVSGQADGHGRYTAGLLVRYKVSKPTAGLVTAQAQVVRATASRSAKVTITPPKPRHVSSKMHKATSHKCFQTGGAACIRTNEPSLRPQSQAASPTFNGEAFRGNTVRMTKHSRE